MAFALCLLLALVGPSPVVDPFVPYRHQPVRSVDVTAPDGNEPAALRALIDIQPGYILQQADVEAAIKRLYALGRFAQVEVFAERESGTVQLHFVVHPLKRLGDIAVDGTHAVSQADLRHALHVADGDEVDSRTENELRARALAFLRRSGYASAEVATERTDDREEGQVNYTVHVHEGPPQRVRSLAFVGAPKLASALLADMVHVHPGRRLDLNELEEDRQALRQLYVEHGFLQARVAPPHVEADGDLADVRIEINAGERIDIAFTGHTVFSDAELRALWPDPASVPAVTTLEIFRQRIIAQYVRQGFSDAKVTLRSGHILSAGLRRYVYLIDEGGAFEVRDMEFVGVHAFTQDLLREQIRATLRRELSSDNILTRMSGKDMATQGPRPWGEPLPPPPPLVAPEDRWVPDIYQSALDQVAAAYRDIGYLTADIARPLLISPCHDKKTARQPQRMCPSKVRVEVHEGDQTNIASIAFAGNVVISAIELLDVVHEATANRSMSAPVAPGAPLSQSGVEDGRIDIIRHYRNQGYLYARVFTNVTLSADGLHADVRYVLEEGPQVRVQRVLVRGNRYTREPIIRSRIATQPGDVYRLEQAVADQRSVGVLGVFSNVRVKLVDEEHPAERKDVVADVTERNRQPIELAPGISTAYGPRLRATYSHLNVLGTASVFTASLKINRQIFFDFFGQYANLLRDRYNGYVGIEQFTKALEREIRTGLRSPPVRFLPFDPVFRLDLVDQRVNAVRYSFDSEAVIFGIDMFMPWRFKSSLEAQLGLINLECEESIDPNCNESPDLRRLQSVPIDVGQRWTLKGGPLVVWDHRDSPINPTRGVLTSVHYTYAIGSASPGHQVPFEPFAFAKYEGNITGYVPLWGVTLAMALRGGTIQLARSQVPIDERFFMGGRDTLRGYVESTLIPQDACVGTGTPPPGCAEQIVPAVGYPPLSRGGNTYLLLKTELRIPLRDNISLDLFCDIGNLWVDIAHVRHLALRMGTGAGLRYATPVGALAIDVGINPAPRLDYGEPWWQVHFSIGSF